MGLTERVEVTWIIPLLFMLVIGSLWGTTAYLNHSLVKAIAKKPDLLRQFPEAGWSISDPAKLFFFLSEASRVLLSKEPQLLKRRKLLIWFLVVSVVVPPILVFALVASMPNGDVAQ